MFCNFLFLQKHAVFETAGGKYCAAGQVTDDNMSRAQKDAICMLVSRAGT